jgi:acetylornithine deacetylase/succinyl-diaminopimelate desuccinylase-like protein
VTDQEMGKRHLDTIAARPRPAGSDEEKRAREYCRSVLEEAGFATSDEPFEYSAFPGRYATPLAGWISVVALGSAGFIGYRGHETVAMALLGCAAIGMGAFFGWCAGRGVLDLSFIRARAVNLVATRGDPTVWLMAHLDTKSQPVSMAARVVGITGSVIVWIVAGALAVSGVYGWLTPEIRAFGWPTIGIAGVAAGLPVAASMVGNRSRGAFDNASGVATLLVVAASIPAQNALGVVITSAEELGLAGARAWVRERKPAFTINFDGVDDAGTLTAMKMLRSGDLAVAFRKAAIAAGVPHRIIQLIPGLLTDSVALDDVGLRSITVSHGSFASLGRVHRPGDTADRITGSGIARAANVTRHMIEELA